VLPQCTWRLSPQGSPNIGIDSDHNIYWHSQVGLLPKDNPGQVPFAFKMYKRTDAAGLELCAGFKETYCQDVQIEFMGVWYVVFKGFQIRLS